MDSTDEKGDEKTVVSKSSPLKRKSTQDTSESTVKKMKQDIQQGNLAFMNTQSMLKNRMSMNELNSCVQIFQKIKIIIKKT